MKIKPILTLGLLTFLLGCNPTPYTGGGTFKPWMAKKVKEAGLELKWNINGDFDVPQEQLPYLEKLPLGQILMVTPQEMTSETFTRYSEWVIKRPKEPYPYPAYVVVAQCEKTIVFAQVASLYQYTQDLHAGKFGNCHDVALNLGQKTNDGPIAITSTSASEPTSSASSNDN